MDVQECGLGTLKQIGGRNQDGRLHVSKFHSDVYLSLSRRFNLSRNSKHFVPTNFYLGMVRLAYLQHH